MPAIPCASYSGSLARANLAYVQYSMATWTHWCRQNGADFILLQQPLGGEDFQDLPPTIQRWVALETLVEKFGPDSTFAFVDADTMIRWDSPNIFDLAGSEFTAVRDWNAPWIYRSIKTYQSFFPETRLDWWEYFNAGMVILNATHLELIRALLAFALHHKAALKPLFQSWQVGDDQTPFNFLAKQAGIRVHYLDARFNMIHCFPFSQELFLLENQGALPSVPEDTPINLAPSQLDFIEMGYIWHFNNVVRAKSLVMARTWAHISAAYPDGRKNP
jgi:hypothetical protein